MLQLPKNVALEKVVRTHSNARETISISIFNLISLSSVVI